MPEVVEVGPTFGGPPPHPLPDGLTCTRRVVGGVLMYCVMRGEYGAGVMFPLHVTAEQWEAGIADYLKRTGK